MKLRINTYTQDQTFNCGHSIKDKFVVFYDLPYSLSIDEDHLGFKHSRPGSTMMFITVVEFFQNKVLWE